jgi:hypothetical protein
VTIVNSSGEVVASFTSPKNIESVVYSSSAIITGESYTIVVGANTVGTATAGDYTNEMMGGPGGAGGQPPAR